MKPAQLTQAIGLLERAKDEMIRATDAAAKGSDWDLAERIVPLARTLDEMIANLKGNGRSHEVRGIVGSRLPEKRIGRLPSFVVRGNHLVKVGPSRDGNTYEH